MCPLLSAALIDDTASIMMCVLMGVSSLVLMVVELVRGRRDRRWSALRLATGLVYAGINLGACAWMVSVDPFGLFDPVYVSAVSFFGPLTVVGVYLFTIRHAGEEQHLGSLAFATWIASVGLAHVWIIAQASASV